MKKEEKVWAKKLRKEINKRKDKTKRRQSEAVAVRGVVVTAVGL